ncbi:MAG: DUF5666 domain-containing protein [Vicinamibacterales bacterium]
MNTVRHLKNGILAAVMLMLATSASALGLQDRILGGAGLAFQQLHVEGKGVVSEVVGTCPAVVLTISGIPVTVDASTTFPFGQTCEMLAANQLVEVRGTLTVTGTTLSVVATMLEIEDGSEGEGEGRVTEVSGTCPNLTITVDGLTVTADALTRYVPANRGAGCDQIRVGTKIKVKAVPAAGGGFRARLIEIKGQRHFGHGEGRITSVSGVCPDATIMLGMMAVQVNAATDFVGGTCADLAPGVRVEARGFRDDDSTTNIASWIRFKSRRVEGRSTVTAVTGTCPALTFTVGGSVRVVTDAATVFKNGSCETIRVGVKVHVRGDMQNEDGAVIAEEVEIEGHPGGRPGGRIEGQIATLGGTCPALTLTVRGIPVTTSASTHFDDIACARLAVGMRVEVEGDLQGGTLVATKIERED